MGNRGSQALAFLAIVAMALSILAHPAEGGTPLLRIQLPERSVRIPLTPTAGALHLKAEELASALEATVEGGPGGAVALRWDRRRITFVPNQRKVGTSEGTALLSAPARRLGEVLWLPVDAAAAAARERFGSNRVRWDARAPAVLVAATATAFVPIRALRVGSHPDRVRVVLEAEQAVTWSARPEGEGRLVVVLPRARLDGSISPREYGGGLLLAIDPMQGPEGAEVRLIFNGRADQARSFVLQNPFRIVIDLYRPASGPAPPAVASTVGGAEGPDNGGNKAEPAAPRVARPRGGVRPEPAAPPPRPVETGQADSSVASRQDPPPAPAPPAAAPIPFLFPPDGRGAPPVAAPGAMGPPAIAAPPGEPHSPAGAEKPVPGVPLTIVIDPGHGGKDTGAIGPHGLREKDIVLDIGLRLRRQLVERLGAHAIMTRSDDTFIPLEQRTAIANRARADFFISIHVNAAPSARATGVETYYLSREPSDGDARASAARENVVLNLEGIGPREQDSLKAVLLDMAQTLHMRESSALAEMLLEDLGRGLRLETRGVKHGPFMVLMTTGMPSSLVEVGFLSNPHEERRLQDETYRQHLAGALLQGIEKFAHRYQRRLGMQPPPPGRS